MVCVRRAVVARARCRSWSIMSGRGWSGPLELVLEVEHLVEAGRPSSARLVAEAVDEEAAISACQRGLTSVRPCAAWAASKSSVSK